MAIAPADARPLVPQLLLSCLVYWCLIILLPAACNCLNWVWGCRPIRLSMTHLQLTFARVGIMSSARSRFSNLRVALHSTSHSPTYSPLHSLSQTPVSSGNECRQPDPPYGPLPHLPPLALLPPLLPLPLLPLHFPPLPLPLPLPWLFPLPLFSSFFTLRHFWHLTARMSHPFSL